jgi:hypothetical protein
MAETSSSGRKLARHFRPKEAPPAVRQKQERMTFFREEEE